MLVTIKPKGRNYASLGPSHLPGLILLPVSPLGKQKARTLTG